MRVLVTLVAVLLLAVGGCGRVGGDQQSVAAPVGTWRSLPAPPLPARADSLGIFTGREVVFLGGDRHPCAPWVSCDAAVENLAGPGHVGMTRDAVAYDLRTGRWRRLARVPAFVDAGCEAAYAAGRIFLGTARGWFAYDLRHDTWAHFPGRWRPGYGLSAVGDRIYGQSRDGSAAIAYDARTHRWRTYPRDPIRPRLGGMTVTGTPSGPVLGGYDSTRPVDVHHGSPALVDVWDGHGWRRIGQTGQLERGWVWTGRRLADPTIGDQDHGDEYAWDQSYPYGGTLDLDSGDWRPLPAALQKAPRGWDVTSQGWPAASGGSGWFVTEGRVYDDATGRAWPLPRPSGAPEVDSSAVWADGKLVVSGGASFTGQRLTRLDDRAWIYTP